MPAIEILVDGQLSRVDLGDRRTEEVARAPSFVFGVTADGRGRVVACCSDEGLLRGAPLHYPTSWAADA
jgi:hypothetical protein